MTSAIAHHRRHPLALTLIVAGAALLLVSLVLNFTDAAPLEDWFFWPGIALVLVANIVILLQRPRQGRAA